MARKSQRTWNFSGGVVHHGLAWLVPTLELAAVHALTGPAVLSFGFYHFARILLLTYKPGPKFAIRNATGLSDTNVSAVDASVMLADFISNKFSGTRA